jgi:hypothetical protein
VVVNLMNPYDDGDLFLEPVPDVTLIGDIFFDEDPDYPAVARPE